MLTKFGRLLRKVRIDYDERLKDMADKLGVTAAYLSAVENDNRKIPENWVDEIIRRYNLDNNLATELRDAADDTKKVVTLKIDGSSAQEREVALSFARRFNNFSTQDLSEIQKILNKE